MSFHHAKTPAGIRAAQKKLIRDLTKRIVEGCLKQIEVRNVPEDWDGIELRAWLAARFVDEAFTLYDKSNRKRYRAFKNEMLVRNL